MHCKNNLFKNLFANLVNFQLLPNPCGKHGLFQVGRRVGYKKLTKPAIWPRGFTCSVFCTFFLRQLQQEIVISTQGVLTPRLHMPFILADIGCLELCAKSFQANLESDIHIKQKLLLEVKLKSSNLNGDISSY